MKMLSKLLVVGTFAVTVGLMHISQVHASEISTPVSTVITNPGQPTQFDNITDINEVVRIIDNYYEHKNGAGNITILAAPGTKWGEGTVEYIGQGSQLITNYYWVQGSEMVSWNIVGNAQRKAVIAKYGSVNNNTSYKMKTQQKLNLSPQTQGYVTVSAQAWCYGRD